MSKLGQVMTRSAAVHFEALRELAIYLVRTRYDGPLYWRRTPDGRQDLEDVPFLIWPPPVDNKDKSPWAHNGLLAIHLVQEEVKGEIDTLDAQEELLEI